MIKSVRQNVSHKLYGMIKSVRQNISHKLWYDKVSQTERQSQTMV